MLGYEAEECLHHPYYHWIYPEDVNKDKDRMEKLKSGKTASLQLEKRLIHKQGDIRWVSCMLSTARKEGRNYTRLCGAFYGYYRHEKGGPPRRGAADPVR